MEAKINIVMDNAAFLDELELSRILKKLAERLENGPETDYITLRDSNGKKVGLFVRE